MSLRDIHLAYSNDSSCQNQFKIHFIVLNFESAKFELEIIQFVIDLCH